MLASTLYGQDEFEFRHGIRWGMPQWQVKNLETGQYEKTYKNNVIFQDTAASHNAKLWYEFKEGRLAEISCFLEMKYTDNNKYITEYNRIRRMLEGRYGRATVISEKWNDDRYKRQSGKKATALAEGALEYITTWRIDSIDTGIMLHMSGNGDGEINISIIYTQLSAKEKFQFDNGL